MSSTALASYGSNSMPAPSDPRLTGGTAVRPVFSPDAAGDRTLDRARTAALLAEVAVHAGAGTPCLIALYGPPGSGRSTLLGQILDDVVAFGRAAEAGGRQTPFVAGIVTAFVDAAAGRDPAAAIVAGVCNALGPAYPQLAEETVYAGSDPLAAAHAAGERANDLRRKLDTERRALDDLAARRNRLVDTVLFEPSGSRVDAYARARRSSIEPRLRSFGFMAPDPLQSYKELVRDAAAAGGRSPFAGLLRAMWSYKGQGTLLVFAVLLLVLGLLCRSLAQDLAGLNVWLDGLGDHFSILAGWTKDHETWLSPIGSDILGLAGVSLLANLVRAVLFLQPIAKGASLLKGDLDQRGQDLDGLIAHQTRRVDQLAAEVETAARIAAAAERRVEARRTAGHLLPDPSLGVVGLAAAQGPQVSAETFFAGLSAAVDGTPVSGGTAASGTAAVPGRIVVAIDGLDILPPAGAAAYVETAYRLLGRRPFVCFAAVQRSHLAAGFSETDPAFAAARIDRCVQLSYDLGQAPLAPSLLASRLLSPDGGAAPTTGQPGPEWVVSALDAPWKPFETDLVQALAPFAGGTPRSLKRFVNAFRLARADPRLDDATAAERAGLALALALDGSGVGAEIPNLEAELEGAPVRIEGELSRALAAARQAAGVSFSLAQARLGLRVARSYSQRG